MSQIFFLTRLQEWKALAWKKDGEQEVALEREASMYLVMSTSSTRLVDNSSCKIKLDVNFVTFCLATLFQDFFDCFVSHRYQSGKLQNQGFFVIIFQTSNFSRIEYFRSLWLVGFQDNSRLLNVAFWIEINEVSSSSLPLNHRRQLDLLKTIFLFKEILSCLGANLGLVHLGLAWPEFCQLL